MPHCDRKDIQKLISNGCIHFESDKFWKFRLI